MMKKKIANVLKLLFAGALTSVLLLGPAYGTMSVNAEEGNYADTEIESGSGEDTREITSVAITTRSPDEKPAQFSEGADFDSEDVWLYDFLTWCDNDTGRQADPYRPEYGHTYTAHISIGGRYPFASDMKVTVNGQPAEVISVGQEEHGGNIAMVYYTVPPFYASLSVTDSDLENAAATLSKTSGISASDEVTLTIAADEGFQLSHESISVETEGCTLDRAMPWGNGDNTIFKYTLTDFRSDSDISVKVSGFATKKPITTATTISASGSQSLTVNYGEKYSLTAQTTADGKAIAGTRIVYYTDSWEIIEGGSQPTAPGTYYAHAVFDGDESYEYSTSQDIVTITIKEPASDKSGDNVTSIGDKGGRLTVGSDTDKTAPAVKVTTKASAIVDILRKDGTLTPDEIADIEAGRSAVDVILGVKDNSDSISPDLFEAFRKKADKEGMAIARCMDITLTKYIIPDGMSKADATNAAKITELSDGIEITITIPDDFINTDKSMNRTYYILRSHDGEISVLDGEITADGTQFTFTTDRFSDYILAYKDTSKTETGKIGVDDSSNAGNSNTNSNNSNSKSTTENSAAEGTASSSPNTGDGIPTNILFILLVGSAAGFIMAARIRLRGRR